MTYDPKSPKPGEFYIVSREWSCHSKSLLPELFQVLSLYPGHKTQWLCKLLHYPTYNSSQTNKRGHAVLTHDRYAEWKPVENIQTIITALIECERVKHPTTSDGTSTLRDVNVDRPHVLL